MEEKIICRVPKVGDSFLVYSPKGEYCYFGIVVESIIEPQCRQYGTSHEKHSKKSFFNFFKKKKEENLPKHHHFLSCVLDLSNFDFFGVQLPIFDASFLDSKTISCLEGIEQENELLYIGKEEILNALSTHGFDSSKPYITELCDNSEKILKSMIKV